MLAENQAKITRFGYCLLCILGFTQVKLEVGVMKPLRHRSGRHLAHSAEKPPGAESHTPERGKNNNVEKCELHQAANLKPFRARLGKIKPGNRACAKISALGRVGPTRAACIS